MTSFTITNRFTGYAYASNISAAKAIKLVAKLRKNKDCLSCGIAIAGADGSKWIEQYGELYKLEVGETVVIDKARITSSFADNADAAGAFILYLYEVHGIELGDEISDDRYARLGDLFCESDYNV
jgi:hypothetical protein